MEIRIVKLLLKCYVNKTYTIFFQFNKISGFMLFINEFSKFASTTQCQTDYSDAIVPTLGNFYKYGINLLQPSLT